MRKYSALVTIFALFFGFVFVLPHTVHAHITDPAHSPWTVGMQIAGLDVLGTEEETYVNVHALMSDPLSIPPEGLAFSRSYDFEIPSELQLLEAVVEQGQCTIDGNNVHCETNRLTEAEDFQDAYLHIKTRNTVGNYDIKVQSKAIVNGQEYTDSDTYPIQVKAFTATFNDETVDMLVNEQFYVGLTAEYLVTKYGNRVYEVTFPQDFTINTYNLSNLASNCSYEANKITCITFNTQNSTGNETLDIGGIAGPAIGSSLATLKAWYIGEESNAVTDDLIINSKERGTTDLAWTQLPSIRTLTTDQEYTLSYTFTNNSPHNAHDVNADFTSDRNTIVATAPASACYVDETFDHIRCQWPVILSGESKTITVTVKPPSSPQIENNSYYIGAFVSSYENDTNFDNNYADLVFPTKCTSSIDPTAVVDLSAKIAAKGCTYVGPYAVIKAHATLEKSAYVGGYGATVSENATIATGAMFQGPRDDLQGIMYPYATLGTKSQFIGSIGEHASVGDNVQAGIAQVEWVIVEKQASIGSRSRVDLPRPWEQSVRIFQGKKVPANTVINEAYCEQNPQICTIY